MSDPNSAATELQIHNGPFKGRGPANGEVRPLIDRNGVPIVREGKPVEVWGLHHRTRHALEVFDPLQGWSIKIKAIPGSFNLPDPNTVVSDGKGGTCMAMQPTEYLEGCIEDPSGRVVATASGLVIINGEGAHEAGENRVRARLYDAAGLSAPNSVASELPPEPTQVKRNVVIAGVTAIDAPIHQGKLPEAARQMIEASGSTSAESEAAASTSTTSAEPTPAVESHAQAQAQVAPTDPTLQQDPSVTLNQNLLRQAIQRAKNGGVEVPKFESNEQLQAFYKGLLKKAS